MRKLTPNTEYPTTPGKWRKKYKCHKNKADHTFIVEYASRGHWIGDNKTLVYKQCSACGKKALDLDVW